MERSRDDRVSSMQSLYNGKIHGQFYPPGVSRTVPRRYGELVKEIRALQGPPILNVLEVGSETSGIPDAVRGSLGIPRDRYHCLDISEAVVNALRLAGFPSLKLDVSSERLPFGEESFDLIIMSEVIEHLIDPDFAIREVKRVMRADAILALTTPNLSAWFNRFIILSGRQPVFTETGSEWVFGRMPLLPRSRPVGHLHVFTRTALRDFVSYHGLEILKEVGLPIESSMPSPGHSLLREVDRWVSRFPSLASEILLLLRKRNAPWTGADNHQVIRKSRTGM